jgi:hypothetical protein
MGSERLGEAIDYFSAGAYGLLVLVALQKTR